MERKNKNRQPFEPDRSDPADPAHEACRGLPSDSAADVWADDGLERDGELWELASRIERMPDLEPPPGLVSAVMAAIRGQRAPWWRRLYCWAHAPRTIVITPLSALAVVVLLVLAPALALFWPGGGERQPVGPEAARAAVAFSLHWPEAHSVALIGSFNQWSPQGFQMQRGRAGELAWTLRLVLPAGRYQYAYLVDGQTIVADPRAQFYQDDGFGNRNAVLIVGAGGESSI